MISRRTLAVTAVVLSFGITACAPDNDGLCGQAVSLPSYTTRFLSGLDNFSEDQYEQLRLDSLDVRDVLDMVGKLEQAGDAVPELGDLVDRFIDAMDAAGWDVSVALSSKEAVDAAAALGSSSALALANEVDIILISECGLPSTLAPVGQTPDTLPSPSIPSPLQTDPPATPPNQESEDRELGRLVSTLFGLTLTEDDMLCLGSALQGVYDATTDEADLARYQGQFQKAFDSCSVDFKVPGQ